MKLEIGKNITIKMFFRKNIYIKLSKKSDTKKTIKPELYNDLHPEKSLKNTGFKNEEIAKKTIRLIEKRSLKYQFDVVNTMFNRAKHHPHRTTEMEDSMKIFGKWLEKYKKLKVNEDKNYNFLSSFTFNFHYYLVIICIISMFFHCIFQFFY